MTDPNLGARVSTLCDHESPPIDLEAAIPIKESPNANTRTKAKILRRRLLLTLRLAIKLKRTQRPTLNSDNSEVIIMLDLPMIPIDLEVADQIRGNLELTSALILSHLLSTRSHLLSNPKVINQSKESLTTDPKSKANPKVEVIATSKDLEPPIDLEAAIPIKGSPNANTITKAKVITFFSPGLVRHELKDLLERLRINQKLSNDVEVMSACNPRVGDDLVT
nr:hypothetical protein Iba_chr10bCG13390 [Ipomoea batatas]